MANRMVIELSDGSKMLFGSAGGALAPSDVSAGGDIAGATADKFKDALGSLASLVATLEETVGRMAHRPDTVQLQFMASLTANCDLWVVSGQGEAEFTVTLGWDKSG